MAGINLNSSDTAYTSVTSLNTVQSFVAENGSRVGLMVYNNSAANLYLAIDADATTTDFVLKLPPGALYEMPRGYYTGSVTGIWDTANGSAKVIEISTRNHNNEN